MNNFIFPIPFFILGIFQGVPLQTYVLWTKRAGQKMKDKKVITAMWPKYSIRLNSRNYHFWIQETESMLIILVSSVEEMSINYT